MAGLSHAVAIGEYSKHLGYAPDLRETTNKVGHKFMFLQEISVLDRARCWGSLLLQRNALRLPLHLAASHALSRYMTFRMKQWQNLRFQLSASNKHMSATT